MEACVGHTASWLSTSDTSTDDIAYQFDFSDHLHFSKQFKKRYRLTPVQYLRQGIMF